MSLEGGKLLLLDENGEIKKTFKAKDKQFKIGYYMTCDYVLEHENAKGVHCQISCDAFGRISIKNFCPDHPIFLDGYELKTKRPLISGMSISVLGNNFRWEYEAQDKSNLQTPSKEIRKPTPAPLSEPSAKGNKAKRRFTINSYTYTIQPSTETTDADTKKQTDDENSSQCSTVVEQQPRRSISTEEPTNENVKDETLSNSKQLLLSLCESSEYIFTSYSPLASPSKTNVNFAYVTSDKTTPQNATVTPLKALSENVILLPSDKNPRSSMSLIDLVTPVKSKTPKGFKPANLLQSVLKNSAKKRIFPKTETTPRTPRIDSSLRTAVDENIDNTLYNTPKRIKTSTDVMSTSKVDENPDSSDPNPIVEHISLDSSCESQPNSDISRLAAGEVIEICGDDSTNSVKKINVSAVEKDSKVEFISNSGIKHAEEKKTILNKTETSLRLKKAATKQETSSEALNKSLPLTGKSPFKPMTLLTPRTASRNTKNASLSETKTAFKSTEGIKSQPSTSKRIVSEVSVAKATVKLSYPSFADSFTSSSDEKSKPGQLESQQKMLVASKVTTTKSSLSTSTPLRKNTFSATPSTIPKRHERCFHSISTKSALATSFRSETKKLKGLNKSVTFAATPETKKVSEIDLNSTFTVEDDEMNVGEALDTTYNIEESQLEEADLNTKETVVQDEVESSAETKKSLPQTEEDPNYTDGTEKVSKPIESIDDLFTIETMLGTPQVNSFIKENDPILPSDDIQSVDENVFKTPSAKMIMISGPPSDTLEKETPFTVSDNPEVYELSENAQQIDDVLFSQEDEEDRLLDQYETVEQSFDKFVGKPILKSYKRKTKSSQSADVDVNSGDSEDQPKRDIAKWVEDVNSSMVSATPGADESSYFNPNPQKQVGNNDISGVEILESTIGTEFSAPLVYSDDSDFENFLSTPNVKNKHSESFSTRLLVNQSDSFTAIKPKNTRRTLGCTQEKINQATVGNEDSVAATNDVRLGAGEDECLEIARDIENPADKELFTKEAVVLNEASENFQEESPSKRRRSKSVTLASPIANSSITIGDVAVPLEGTNLGLNVEKEQVQREQVLEFFEGETSVKLRKGTSLTPELPSANTTKSRNSIGNDIAGLKDINSDLNEEKERIEREKALENLEVEPSVRPRRGKSLARESSSANTAKSRKTLGNAVVDLKDINFDLNEEKERIEREKALQNLEVEPSIRPRRGKSLARESSSANTAKSRKTLGNAVVDLKDINFDLDEEKERIERENALENLEVKPSGRPRRGKSLARESSSANTAKSRKTLGNAVVDLKDINFDLNEEKERIEREKALQNLEVEPSVRPRRGKSLARESSSANTAKSRKTLGNAVVDLKDINFDLNDEKERIEREKALQNLEVKPFVRPRRGKSLARESSSANTAKSRKTLGNAVVDLKDINFDLNEEKERIEREKALQNLEVEPSVRPRRGKSLARESSSANTAKSRKTLGNAVVDLKDINFDLNDEKERIEREKALQNLEVEPSVRPRRGKSLARESSSANTAKSRKTLGNAVVVLKDINFDFNKEKERVEREKAFENFQDKPFFKPRRVRSILLKPQSTTPSKFRNTIGDCYVRLKNINFNFETEKKRVERERAFDNFQEEPTVRSRKGRSLISTLQKFVESTPKDKFDVLSSNLAHIIQNEPVGQDIQSEQMLSPISRLVESGSKGKDYLSKSANGNFAGTDTVENCARIEGASMELAEIVEEEVQNKLDGNTIDSAEKYKHLPPKKRGRPRKINLELKQDTQSEKQQMKTDSSTPINGNMRSHEEKLKTPSNNENFKTPVHTAPRARRLLRSNSVTTPTFIGNYNDTEEDFSAQEKKPLPRRNLRRKISSAKDDSELKNLDESLNDSVEPVKTNTRTSKRNNNTNATERVADNKSNSASANKGDIQKELVISDTDTASSTSRKGKGRPAKKEMEPQSDVKNLETSVPKVRSRRVLRKQSEIETDKESLQNETMESANDVGNKSRTRSRRAPKKDVELQNDGNDSEISVESNVPKARGRRVLRKQSAAQTDNETNMQNETTESANGVENISKRSRRAPKKEVELQSDVNNLETSNASSVPNVRSRRVLRKQSAVESEKDSIENETMKSANDVEKKSRTRSRRAPKEEVELQNDGNDSEISVKSSVPKARGRRVLRKQSETETDKESLQNETMKTTNDVENNSRTRKRRAPNKEVELQNEENDSQTTSRDNVPKARGRRVLRKQSEAQTDNENNVQNETIESANGVENISKRSRRAPKKELELQNEDNNPQTTAVQNVSKARSVRGLTKNSTNISKEIEESTELKKKEETDEHINKNISKKRKRGEAAQTDETEEPEIEEHRSPPKRTKRNVTTKKSANQKTGTKDDPTKDTNKNATSEPEAIKEKEEVPAKRVTRARRYL